jgi:hypothetical protein
MSDSFIDHTKAGCDHKSCCDRFGDTDSAFGDIFEEEERYRTETAGESCEERVDEYNSDLISIDEHTLMNKKIRTIR